MDVTVVDFSAVDAPASFARSMRETGFGVLDAHPIPDGLIPEISAEWLAFFATDAKHAYVHADGEQDGYFPPPADAEPAPGGLVRDRKEFFHVFPGGRYPAEVSDAALRYFAAAKDLASTLLAWLDSAAPAPFSMPLPQMIEGSTGSMLRIQHYLPLTVAEPPGSLRALAHEDINLITLLPAPSEPGLQVQDVGGTWHEIGYEARSLIVNGGEMLQLASDRYYPATPHRVVNPTGGQARGSRLSLPLFVHPAPGIELAPGRVASEFLQERVDALRSKGWLVAPGGKGGRG